MPPSPLSSHMTHHPSLGLLGLPLTFGYSNTWPRCLSLSLSLHPGGPEPDCMWWEGTAWCPHPPCCVFSGYPVPMGHQCRPEQAWDVCKQPGGEAASRALTQAPWVVQAKREKQGRHCHLAPKLGESATWQGEGGAWCPSYFLWLLFQAHIWDAISCICFLQGCEEQEHSRICECKGLAGKLN